MATVFDVKGSELIKEISADLKEKVKEPGFARFVKTGRHRERAPSQKDWYYTRMAAILRRIYIEGPLGTQRLRSYFGGKRNRGSAPAHFYKASGKIVRLCLQELEKLGLIKKQKKGRSISAKGEKYLSEKTKIVLTKMKKGTEHGRTGGIEGAEAH